MLLIPYGDNGEISWQLNGSRYFQFSSVLRQPNQRCYRKNKSDHFYGKFNDLSFWYNNFLRISNRLRVIHKITNSWFKSVCKFENLFWRYIEEVQMKLPL